MAATNKVVPLTNGAYDLFRNITNYWLPAFGTLYFALAIVWGLPHGEQVVGTVTAIVIFMNVVLGVSKKAYNATPNETQYDGALVVNTSDPMKDSYVLEVDTPLDELQGKTSITLKVNSFL